MFSDLTLGFSFKVKTRVALLISCLLLLLPVFDVIPTNRKSWAGNLLVWSDLIWGPLLQGPMRLAKLKSAYISLIIAPTSLGCETN